ncbi:hypothetical protein DL546_000343 [Coniochaeta pulveracea]|uniref:Protein kinase domain-containing protein n=1 Tax=Coniochaeta pulveracea TaxID=177199 RepID=A0A420YF57_9PEZI|nr:hypothetical protein DL546_000343 [Coniochaeta pulveracea]
MSYSNGSGGTLTLPSPTNVHHVDVNAAVRSLRRSLSRSPSRFGMMRTASGPSSGSGETTPSHTPQSHSQSPSPHHSPRRLPAQDAGINFSTPSGTQPFSTSTPNTTAFTPFRSGVKLSVRSARPRPLTARPATRNRTSPKSPLKRVLGASSDSGNVASPAKASMPEAPGQEDAAAISSVKFQDFAFGLSQTLTPASRRAIEKSGPSRHSVHLDLSGASKHSFSKFLDMNKGEHAPTTTASPLKRSDAIMDLDQPNQDSPVAKRRSLHGISALAGDFNVFDNPPPPTSQPSFEIHEDPMNHEYQLTGTGPSLFRDQAAPPTPTVPRRSSSLRKTTLQQRHGDLRTSWGRRQGENQLPSIPSEDASPAPPRTRPRLSLDQYLPPDPRGSPFSAQGPLPNPSMHMFGGQQTQQAQPGHQRHPLSRTFTQSSSGSSLADDSPTHFPAPKVIDRPRLPLNFSKSVPVGAQRPNLSGDANGNELVATPAYKNAKPDQHAFASTGLVSKVGRRAELEQRAKFENTPTPMPDTPCKKQAYPSNTFPPQSSLSGRRASRPSFSGAAPSPFNLPSKAPIFPAVFGNTEKTGGLFFNKPRRGLSRRSSLLSLDGDDPHGMTDGDYVPPTPTKNLFFSKPSTSSQSTTTPTGSPSTSRFFTAPTAAPAHDQDGQGSNADLSPLELMPATASPSPRTPRDAFAPLDASRLSISNSQNLSSSIGSGSGFDRPPATPTTQGRVSLLGLGGRRFSITPGEHTAETDYDTLRRRFSKVEPIGSGEFSHVFKVTESSQPSIFNTSFSSTPSRRTPINHEQTNRVFVVKKINAPITGPKERKKRYHEVEVLRALSHCEHVVRYYDSWEESFQLYIQTEYCEEGSLNEFLDNVGKTGRLDDFRLWKIMLELTQGLREIHDGGFIHLDLKPANIFVTYEGKLKIGDFGLAAEWPVQTSIDGEGDRVYIAPEILQGHYDKPADIFSLGLMLLEAAANVCLPDNGSTWMELREGNMSNVQSLTSTTAGSVVRDATGTPIGLDSAISPPAADCIPFQFSEQSTATHDASNLFGSLKRSELQSPPDFMIDASHPSSLDNIVKWMIHKDPAKRPTAAQLLEVEALVWVAARRHAGATVYEGNWGPEGGPTNDLVEESVDTEMTDA